MKAICLQCRKGLPLLVGEEIGEYSCKCGCKIPYSHGIYQFVKTDNFYEGRFTKSTEYDTTFKLIVMFFLRIISIDGNEERMWQRSIKYIKEHNTNYGKLQILNIGSGGSHSFLKQLGFVTCVDLSMESLVSAKRISDYCYQANTTCLPFADESFDLVFSAHLFGHIPLEQKREAIREIYRVTRKNGFSLHSVECEADNFIYRKAKKYPKLFKKYFQDMYGHYGLEYPSFCKKRFRDELFVPIYEMSDYCKGIIRPASSYKVFFGEREFMEKEILFYVLASISKVLSFNMSMCLLSGILLYPFVLLNCIWGPDSVDSVKLLYQKKG